MSETTPKPFICPSCGYPVKDVEPRVGGNYSCKNSGKLVYFGKDLKPTLSYDKAVPVYTRRENDYTLLSGVGLGAFLSGLVALYVGLGINPPKPTYQLPPDRMRYTLSVSPEKLPNGDTFIHRFHTKEEKDKRTKAMAPVIPIELMIYEGTISYRAPTPTSYDPDAWEWVKLDPKTPTDPLPD